MKNIIGVIILSVLVLAPIATPKPVSASTPDAQTVLLIQLLMEKVKMLQAELAILIKAKSEPAKVEIVGKDSEYKKAVGPLVDQIDEKNKVKTLLEAKIKEKKCTKPFRVSVPGGGVKFTCKSSEFEFSGTSTVFEISTTLTIYKLAEAFGLQVNEIEIIPSTTYREWDSYLTTPAKAIIPPNRDLKILQKDLQAIDQEITDLNLKINSLKNRYGISTAVPLKFFETFS